MSSTVGSRIAIGQVVATGANLDIRTVGFKPRLVEVMNLDNNVTIRWWEGLANGYAEQTIEAGTRSLETADGITPLDASGDNPPGFRIGALAHINDTTTEVLAWIAYE
jgi:hypothetical protein